MASSAEQLLQGQASTTHQDLSLQDLQLQILPLYLSRPSQIRFHRYYCRQLTQSQPLGYLLDLLDLRFEVRLFIARFTHDSIKQPMKCTSLQL